MTAPRAVANRLADLERQRNALQEALRHATHPYDGGAYGSCTECFGDDRAPQHQTPAKVYASLTREARRTGT